MTPRSPAPTPAAVRPETAEPVAPRDEPGITRAQARSRRARAVRARTISVKRLSRREVEAGRALFPIVADGEGRPQTRAGCGTERPCPFVSCRHHLYLDVLPRSGAIKLNTPELEVWELAESCTLDLADRGALRREHVGDLLNVTRERIRMIEVDALDRVRGKLARLDVDRDDVLDGDGARLPIAEAEPASQWDLVGPPMGDGW